MRYSWYDWMKNFTEFRKNPSFNLIDNQTINSRVREFEYIMTGEFISTKNIN